MAHETMASKAYGITERVAPEDEVALHVERVRVLGYSVVPAGFTPADVDGLAARLDAVLERQVAEFGAERLDRIGDSLQARCLLAYDDAFLRLATHATVLSIVRQLVGDYVVLMQQNGIVNAPGQEHTQRAYHRDLPYQHFTSSRPLAVSALFCLDAFRPDTGATTVLPGSHKVETFPSETLAADLDTPVTAERGSFIVFDSMLFHRAGVNRADHVRRAVNQVYSIPLIAQQISLPDALDGRYRDDPALARLLGYESEPARSVAAWRERRWNRLRG